MREMAKNSVLTWRGGGNYLRYLLGIFFLFLSEPASAEKIVNADTFPATQWGRISYGKNRDDMSGEAWMDIALKDYTAMGAGDTANLNGGNTSWQTSYLKRSQLRFDGWFHVDSDRAGEWIIYQTFDDYFALFIDGAEILHNNTFQEASAVSTTAAVEAGWHRFTIIAGDTYGGYGSEFCSLGDGSKVPFKITVNNTEYPFDSFTQGAGESVYTLTQDEDWSSEGKLSLSNGAIVDLNGYNLTVSDIDSDYIGAYVTNSAKTASFVYFTGNPADSTAVAKELIKKGGNIALVNKDEKILVWDGGCGAWKTRSGETQTPGIDDALFVTGGDVGNLQIPAESSLLYKSFAILGECTLTQDCDWRGLASSPVVADYVDAPRGAYIDTGFNPNQDTRIVMDVTVLDSSKREYWCGAWKRTGNGAHADGAFAVGNDAKNYIYTGYGNQGGGVMPAVPNGRHTIDYDKGVLTIDGSDTAHTKRTYNEFQLNYPLYLFVQNRAGSPFPGDGQTNIRLHSCQIYDNGTKVRDYVPICAGSEFCLYDKINGTFSTSGSSTQLAGKAPKSNVEINGTINLAGYDLTLGDTEGAGTITAPPARYADENKEYIRIEYVATDGAQYIDTGVWGHTGNGYNVKIESDFMAVGEQAWHYIAGVKMGNYHASLMVRGTQWGVGHGRAAHDYGYSSDGSFSLNTRYNVAGVLQKGTSSVNVNGQTVCTSYRNYTYGIERNLFAFARNTDGAPTDFSDNILCYSLKITRDVERDFVPVKRVLDGVAGLYDKNEGKFYPSQGERDFIAGPELNLREHPGKLHIVAADGELINNTTLSIAGELTLVKEGAGTFVSSKKQTYTGGTLVLEGTAQPPDGKNTTTYAGNGYYAFGTGDITVAPGGTFDLRGQYAWRGIALAGGSLVNTCSDMYKVTWGASGISKLEADSYLGVTNSIVFSSSPDAGFALNLAGFSLDARVESGRTLFVQYETAAITNGIFKVSGAGTIDFRNDNEPSALNMENTVLDVSCQMLVNRSIDVMDYIARNAGFDNSGSGALNVHGTFSPIEPAFYGPTLQDGATLDVSRWTGAFPVESSSASGVTAMSFAEGATVYVNMGERKISNNTPLVSWSALPAGVSFAWSPEASSGNGRLVAREDGLYVVSGFIIYLK